MRVDQVGDQNLPLLDWVELEAAGRQGTRCFYRLELGVASEGCRWLSKSA